MNKKLFLGMFAAATMLFATSCQNDELDAVQSGNEATVSFNLGVEGGVQTRATISDGSGANKLVYAVFDKDGNRITTIAKVEKATTFPTTENITLAKGQTYKVAFWAQNSATSAYVLDDDMNLTIDYTSNYGKNNDEDRDAFFKTETFTVTGNTNIYVELKRPFAQLNVGVYTGDDNKNGKIESPEENKDWEYAEASGVTIETSKVVIKNAATTLDLVSGNVGGKTEVTYDFNTIPTQWLEVETDATKTGKEHFKYLSMSYFLVNTNGDNGVVGDGDTKANLDGVEFTFRSGGNDIVLGENDGLTQVPVQRNWRTNIIGKLLTGDVDFTISIDPIYDGEYNNGTAYPVELKGVYYKTIEEALANAVDGDVINLGASEYTLPGSIKLKDNATGTITFAGEGEQTVVKGSANANGMNVIMKNLKWTSPSTGYDTAFIHAASVKFENCNITGQYYAQSLAPHTFADCTIDPQTGYLYTYGANCTFDGCTFNSSNGKALQVYTDGTTGESTVNINNCTFTAFKTATTWDGKSVTAIDINSFANEQGTGHKFNVNINNTTASGYGVGEYSGSTLWNIKGGQENVTVNIDGKKVNDAVEANGVKYGTIAAALAAGATEIKLAEGTYTIPAGAKNQTLSFIGVGDAEKTIIAIQKANNPNEPCDYGFDGSNVTFENLTIEANPIPDQYSGFVRCNGTYKKCIIENQYTLYGTSSFEGCTFHISGNKYNLWTWGASADFTKCTFNCNGKAVLVYGGGTSEVTFTDCAFNDFGGVDGKAAIETGNDYDATYTIKINDCEVNGFDVNSVSGSNVWGNKNSMSEEKLNVVIDNVEVY